MLFTVHVNNKELLITASCLANESDVSKTYNIFIFVLAI